MNNGQYYWVVICKNHKFHRHQNLFSGHRVLLGETDAYMSQPVIDGTINVRCDECGKEYSYRPAEVLRCELDLTPAFAPHPLFREA